MTTISKLLIAAAVAAMPLGLLAGTGSASAVTVLNNDFASPNLTPGGYDTTGGVSAAADTAITSWGLSGYGGLYQYATPPTGIDGNQVFFTDTIGGQALAGSSEGYNADVYQDVGALLPNTTYSLTVAMDYSGSSSYAGEVAVLDFVNGTSDSVGTSSGSLLATQSYTPTTTFTPISLSYTTGNSVSGDLTLVLGSGSPENARLNYNNVQLTTTPVPEPATLGLVAIGGMSLLLLKRRKIAAKLFC